MTRNDSSSRKSPHCGKAEQSIPCACSDRTRKILRFIPHLEIRSNQTVSRHMLRRSIGSFLLSRSRPQYREVIPALDDSVSEPIPTFSAVPMRIGSIGAARRAPLMDDLRKTRSRRQPPLNILGCAALLNAVRAGSPQTRVKLRTHRRVSA